MQNIWRSNSGGGFVGVLGHSIVVLGCLVVLAPMAAAGDPRTPAVLDGHWKLDRDRSDSFEPVMTALEISWLVRRIASVGSIRMEMQTLDRTCDTCPYRIAFALRTPLRSQESTLVLDGEPRPGKDPSGRDTIDRFTWDEGRGLQMVRELTLPSGKPARLVELRMPGDDLDTLRSELTVSVSGEEVATIQRIFTREGD